MAEIRDSIEELIAAKWATPEWATLFEVRGGPGWGGSREQRLDALTVGMWGGTKHRVIAFEVKRSRGDFMREINDPGKRTLAETVAGECYFVTPSGLVLPDEVPEGWGLYEATNGGLRLKKAATQRKEVQVPYHFALSLVRRAAEGETHQLVPKALWKYAGRELTPAELEQVAVAEFTSVKQLDQRLKAAARAEALYETKQARYAKIEEIIRRLGYWKYGHGEDGPDVEAVVAALSAAPRAASFRGAFGALERARGALAAIENELQALEGRKEGT